MVDRAGIMMQQGLSIAAERVYDNSNMSRSHYHPFFELYYMEEGKRLHILEDNIYQTTPGDIILFAPFIMHHSYSKKANADFKRIALYFTPESIEDPIVLKKLKSQSGLYHVDKKVGQYIHSMLGMLLMEQDNQDDLRDASMKALLNIIVISLLKSGIQENKPESQTLVGKVIDYIDRNYMNDIKLDDLANHFFVSKYYLCHEFKKYTNRTINQYINTTRILYAQQKIMDNNLNFTEIAAECGFASCTHFGRTFKAVTGVTPSEFKSNYKEKIKKEK